VGGSLPSPLAECYTTVTLQFNLTDAGRLAETGDTVMILKRKAP
jgi:hypothetical protein